MPNHKFVDKVTIRESGYKLEPKSYGTEEAYIKEQAPVFGELVQFYEQNYSKTDALRLLNKVERDIGDITAIIKPGVDKGRVSHIKADFMHAYVKEHLPFGFVEKTFQHSSKSRLFNSDLVEALQDKFDLGDQYSNCGRGVNYKGKNASELPEHVDIRDALDDHIWHPAIGVGKKLLQDFIASKNKGLVQG